MNNKPEHYTEQRWVIPEGTQLVRRKDEWRFEYALGVSHVIPHETGTYMAIYFGACNKEEDAIFRRSLRFKWERFWYMRSKTRKRFLAELEERKANHDG